MKRLIICLVLLAAVLFLSLLGSRFVTMVYDEVDGSLRESLSLAEAGDFEGARAAALRAETLYLKYEKPLAAVVNHGFLDDLGRSLSGVAPLAAEDSKEEFLGQLAEARTDLAHMRNDHAFIYSNLF